MPVVPSNFHTQLGLLISQRRRPRHWLHQLAIRSEDAHSRSSAIRGTTAGVERLPRSKLCDTADSFRSSHRSPRDGVQVVQRCQHFCPASWSADPSGLRNHSFAFLRSKSAELFLFVGYLSAERPRSPRRIFHTVGGSSGGRVNFVAPSRAVLARGRIA